MKNLSWSCWENTFKKQPIDNCFIGNIPTLVVCLWYDRTRNTKEIQNCCDDKSILALLQQILLKICLEHPTGRASCGKQKKSDRESQSKQPTAFSVLMRFRSTNRNRFSPTNGREISSSVFGQTRLGQLYVLVVVVTSLHWIDCVPCRLLPYNESSWHWSHSTFCLSFYSFYAWV